MKYQFGEIEKYRRGKNKKWGNKDCLGWRRFRWIEDYEFENFRVNILRCVNYEFVLKGVVFIKVNILLMQRVFESFDIFFQSVLYILFCF